MSIPNPLLNPAILSTVFDLCPVEELQNARRVCKSWRSNSLPTWRARREYDISGGSGSGPLWNPPRSLINRLDKLLPLLGTPEAESRYRLRSLPPRNFFIRWDFSGNIERKMEFWSCCGGWIKILTLINCNFPNVKVFEDILFHKTPCLEKLTLHCNDFPANEESTKVAEKEGTLVPQENLRCIYLNSRSHRNKNLPIRWSRLCSYYPNLKTLTLCYFEKFEDSLNELLLGIKDANGLRSSSSSSNSSKFSLKELDILYLDQFALATFPESSVKLLQEVRLPLEKLKIDIGYDTEPSVIFKLLEVYSDSLKSLVIYKAPFSSNSWNSWPSSSPTIDKFPFGVYFGYLEVLELKGMLLASNFEFLKFTPNLQRLAIYLQQDTAEPEKTIRLMRRSSRKLNKLDFKLGVPGRVWDDVRLETLVELEGDFELEGGKEAVAHLSDWMPNLRKLTIPLDKTTFPAVCQYWKGSLRELHLGGKSRVDDMSLTGIPREWPERRPAFSLEERQPNITDLKYLEKFSYFPTSKILGCLTDHSVVHGLLALPKLRSAHLQFLKPLSRDNERTLKEAVADVRITIAE